MSQSIECGDDSSRVCKLQKNLYRLKKSPRSSSNSSSSVVIPTDIIRNNWFSLWTEANLSFLDLLHQIQVLWAHQIWYQTINFKQRIRGRNLSVPFIKIIRRGKRDTNIQCAFPSLKRFTFFIAPSVISFHYFVSFAYLI